MKRTALESIELKEVSFAYDNEHLVLDKINISLSVNEPLIIQAPMGSGKTTLIKLIMGLMAPTKGNYLINGIKVNDLSFQEFDQYRLNMGHVHEEGGLINNQSLYQNLKLPLDFHNYLSEEERCELILERLKLFKIFDSKDLRPAFASSTTRKITSIIRALILNPSLLILDNPTSGLHSEQVTEMMNLIQFHQNERDLKFILISSEDESFLKRWNAKKINLQLLKVAS